MTVNQFLQKTTKQLERAGIGTARLDAMVLLEDVTGRDRAWLLANTDHEISSDEQAILTSLLNRRTRHEPLAYVRQKTEFYGREFIVTTAVLEPRPESETMIDMLKKLPDMPARPSIADVGAGSGALGITAKLELPNARVELLDIDTDALKVAQKNVDKYTMRADMKRSDLLDSVRHPVDILLCNLPYVPDSHQINQAARHEPDIAIFGGPDGLDIYRRLFSQLRFLKNKPLFILTESLPPQHDDLQAIASQGGYQLTDVEDFIQVFRNEP